MMQHHKATHNVSYGVQAEGGFPTAVQPVGEDSFVHSYAATPSGMVCARPHVHKKRVMIITLQATS